MSIPSDATPFAEAQSPFRRPPNIPAWKDLPAVWLGMKYPVGRRTFALSGFALMLFKYAVEAAVIWFFTARTFMPWQFLNPLISVRVELLRTAPEWLGWALFAWTLPFLWIAVSMSVRRAADAGRSPWLGMLVLVPIINLVFMLVMCFVPSDPHEHWMRGSRSTSDLAEAKSAVLGIAASLLVGGMMVLVSIYLFSSYGASLFLGTPVLMGATASYVFNRPASRSYAASGALGLTAIFFGSVALLLFALEGVICVAMAIPLILPIGAFGGFLGKAIADSTRRPYQEIMAALLSLPVLAGAESLLVPATEYEVMTAVEIDAPPEVVWNHVTQFSEITAKPAWYFRAGISCPERARIDGSGVGATRYCEFTTGTFVEPITVWDAPRRLAFDVTEQPDPMFELSPYRHVHPPHLQGYLRSNRGEFRLVPLAGGQVRLEGRTWYEFAMFPQSYWTLWSDMLLHRIHERVLKHIKQEAEIERQLQDRTGETKT